MTSATFTTAEAHAITRSSQQSIQKLIENKYICCQTVEKGRRTRRVLVAADLLMVMILEKNRELLSKSARTLVHRRLHELNLDGLAEIEVSDLLVLRVEAQVKELVAKIAMLEKAKQMVVRNPKIKGGDPVIRGTRIPVRQLIVMANTMTLEEILEGYPTLTPEHVELARVYCEAYPKQGRPTRNAI